jgi:oxygen-dependent protoporphyrinogen oxidase
VSRARVVVVGAGVAGLTCAHRLHTDLDDVEVVVLDADKHLGGKVRTTEIAGRPVDEAVDGFLARVPEATALCEELGLGDELTQPVAGQALLWHEGRLRPFPDGLVLGVPTDLEALRASGLVSPDGVALAARDLTMPDDGPPAGADESVGSLVRRRLGDEVFEVLVSPLLSGINAGEADQLSVAAGAAQLAAARQDAGGPSLIGALRRQREAAAAAATPGTPVFRGLVGGMQRLTDALAAGLPDVRPATPVRAVATVAGDGTADGLRLQLDAGPLDADAVVLAVPSFRAAPLVAPLSPELAAGLGELEWSSVVLVTFAVPRRQLPDLPAGSGFLVAGRSGLLMTACSFGSQKWAHWDRRGDDLVILRVSAGRHPDRRALDLDDGELVARLTAELRTTLGLTGEPAETRVSRWERSLPQYRPGHLDRARRWKDQASAAHPGLFLTGASYRGLGVPACITDATSTAGAVAWYLHQRKASLR